MVNTSDSAIRNVYQRISISSKTCCVAYRDEACHEKSALEISYLQNIPILVNRVLYLARTTYRNNASELLDVC